MGDKSVIFILVVMFNEKLKRKKKVAEGNRKQSLAKGGINMLSKRSNRGKDSDAMFSLRLHAGTSLVSFSQA